MLRKSSGSIGLILVLAAGGLSATAGNVAQAGTISMPTNGTQACRATSSAGAASFYYNNTYLWNNGTTNQYLTCVLPDWNLMIATPDTALDMAWAAGSTSGSVVCTAQIGAYYGGANQIVQGNTQTLALAAGTNGYLTFATPMNHTTNWQSVNIICNVPAGFKLGLIEHQKTSPTAW